MKNWWRRWRRPRSNFLLRETEFGPIIELPSESWQIRTTGYELEAHVVQHPNSFDEKVEDNLSRDFKS